MLFRISRIVRLRVSKGNLVVEIVVFGGEDYLNFLYMFVFKVEMMDGFVDSLVGDIGFYVVMMGMMGMMNMMIILKRRGMGGSYMSFDFMRGGRGISLGVSKFFDVVVVFDGEGGVEEY